MDARRLKYLEAMGVDVWERRAPKASGPSAATTHVEPPLAASEFPPTADNAGQNVPVAAERPISELDWDELEARVRDCRACPLYATRTQAVFGRGGRDADLMVVGEAPGAEEDRRGQPFVGRAGQLLDVMLTAIGRGPDDVYIANILKSRPPDNRDPLPEEVAACMPYLKRQIALVKPKLLLAVGRVAAQNLLGVTTSLGRLRGTLHSFGESAIPVVVTYHPAYLLRRPADKRKAWEDLKRVRAQLERGDP